MKQDNNFLFWVTIIVLVVALMNFGFVLFKVGTGVTGRATDTAAVNISINQKVSANFSVASINWGPGAVNPAAVSAQLNTSNGTGLASGATVANGNWSTSGVADLLLVNNGNVNVSLEIASTVSASAFIGGGTASGAPAANFSLSVYNHEANSCFNGTAASLNASRFIDVSTSGNGQMYCSNFPFEDNKDAVNISVMILVPYDTNKSTGTRNAVLTATVTAV